MATKPKLLWIGDFCCHSGFARVSHALCERLRDRWDIAVLAINYYGNAHNYAKMFDLYPAALGGDICGVGRYRELQEALRPDVTLVLHDPWWVAPFVQLKAPEDRLVAYIPIDATNQGHAKHLNGLDLAIFYTQFGLDECRASGYRGPAQIIPHGVDRTVFTPQDQREARTRWGLRGRIPENAFLLGAVNRNQHRKRLDLTLMAFAMALADASANVPPLYLVLHTNPNEPVGCNLPQLAEYLGITDRVIFPTQHDLVTEIRQLVQTMDDAQLATLYNTLDLHVSTSAGEGWGLSTAESMSCGIPNLLPDHSAFAEWAAPAARFVPAPGYVTATNNVNTIGRLPEPDVVADAILDLATHPEERARLRQASLDLTAERRFDWDVIASQFALALDAVCARDPLADLMANGMVAAPQGVA